MLLLMLSDNNSVKLNASLSLKSSCSCLLCKIKAFIRAC